MEALLRANLDDVSEVVAFDHTVRSSANSGTRNSPAGHVHGDYDHDKGLDRMRGLLGDERASQWIDKVVYFYYSVSPSEYMPPNENRQLFSLEQLLTDWAEILHAQISPQRFFL